MEIRAWHSVGSDFICSGIFGNQPAVKLGITHVCLPVSIEVLTPLTETDHYLGKAFEYFNWIRDEDILTSIEIGPFIRQNNTHTSMSVGDVIELVDVKEFYIVEDVGFRKLEGM